MEDPRKLIWQKQAQTVMKALESNNMQGFYVPSREDVPALVQQMLHEGDTVAVGGSVTLEETGVMPLLRGGGYRFLDRYAPGLTREEQLQIFRESFFADAYLSSTNAVTLRGELYNVDGNSNRVAALCFGPRSVILVAGCNKIVRDVDEAIARVKACAAPANAVRLSCETYCAKTGACSGVNGSMTDGCKTDARICCTYVVHARQREKNRIKVILVGEDLGY